MSSQAIRQRCRNHEAREAVCRCPQCGESFCRECVTEHEARLLCAGCLKLLARAKEAAPAKAGVLRRLAPAAMTLAGIVIAWLVFFGAAEGLLTMAVRAERTAWRNH